MAKTIPPKSFYGLSKLAQEQFAVRKMQIAYEEAEAWRKLSIQARQHQIPEPKEVERLDELNLKD